VTNFGEVSFTEQVDTNNEAGDLEKCRQLTQMMREHQQSVIRLGKMRRKVVRRLRNLRVPYRTIADACGVTDQALFADLRKHPEDEE
jgi:hypothetical protein